MPDVRPLEIPGGKPVLMPGVIPEVMVVDPLIPEAAGVPTAPLIAPVTAPEKDPETAPLKAPETAPLDPVAAPLAPVMPLLVVWAWPTAPPQSRASARTTTANFMPASLAESACTTKA